MPDLMTLLIVMVPEINRIQYSQSSDESSFWPKVPLDRENSISDKPSHCDHAIVYKRQQIGSIKIGCLEVLNLLTNCVVQ